MTTPAAPVVIPMEALLAITQALKWFNTGNRQEIRPPSFNGEGDLKLFIKQFEDVAEANGWTPRGRCISAANWRVMHKGAAMATVTRRYWTIYTLALECPRDKLEIDWQRSN